MAKRVKQENSSTTNQQHSLYCKVSGGVIESFITSEGNKEYSEFTGAVFNDLFLIVGDENSATEEIINASGKAIFVKSKREERFFCAFLHSEEDDSKTIVLQECAEGIPHQVLKSTYYTGVVFQSGNGFIWAKSLNDSQYSYFSEGLFQLTGYKFAEIENKKHGLLEFAVSEGVYEFIMQRESFYKELTQTALSQVYKIKTANGSEKWIREVIIWEKPLLDLYPMFIGFVVDETALLLGKEGESAKLTDLQQRGRQMDKFINKLSHDLRAPFTSILGFSEILLNEPELPEKERQEYLGYIHESSESELSHINHLLDWSRLRVGKIVPALQSLHMQSMVYNAVSQLTGVAMRKNIEVAIDISESLKVRADDRLLQQVIIQLVSNAIKYSHEGSIVEITSAPFSDTHIELSVKDSGVGIHQDDWEKLFDIEKFIAKPGTKGEKGGGFGLKLTAEIVKQLSGDLWFYSKLGEGSEFKVTLPLPSKNVLLVFGKNNISDFTQLTREVCSDFETTEVNNAYEALEHIEQQLPALLIAYHNLPLMKASQMMAAYSFGSGRKSIPTIIYCDTLSDEIEAMYFNLGAVAVVDSSYSEEFLRSKIAEILLLEH